MIIGFGVLCVYIIYKQALTNSDLVLLYIIDDISLSINKLVKLIVDSTYY